MSLRSQVAADLKRIVGGSFPTNNTCPDFQVPVVFNDTAICATCTPYDESTMGSGGGMSVIEGTMLVAIPRGSIPGLTLELQGFVDGIAMKIIHMVSPRGAFPPGPQDVQHFFVQPVTADAGF